eukprot:maker-scaffold309_size213625-snap-gene-1.27 protein:Tk02556 transcript:maker-scaffold309_size213625-snap-gene-1.27-mRNA-1 annotation:"isoform a"
MKRHLHCKDCDTNCLGSEMATILQSIADKYSPEEVEEENLGFIVFVSNSPECKRGMFPPIMTLIDYDLEAVGSTHLNLSKFSHIAELDLTDNLLSEWSEILDLLQVFPSLEFLNLSNNILHTPLQPGMITQRGQRPPVMQKLVLNGNKIDWNSVHALIQMMPQLDELHLSTNNLSNPTETETFAHPNLKLLFLSCNPIHDFHGLAHLLTHNCPHLEQLSLSECPVSYIGSTSDPNNPILPSLSYLNLSTSKISTWEEVDSLRGFAALNELRIQHVHGKLHPLVNIDMTPDTVVKVKVAHKDQVREEEIQLYQTVQQFKGKLQEWFGVAPQNMKLYYCDRDYVDVAGPEEMKWAQKSLYTYNVQNGDKFILDEKVILPRIRTISRSTMGSYSPGSKFLENRSITFSVSPRNGLTITSPGMKKPPNNNNNGQKKNHRKSGTPNHGQAVRNLFGKSTNNNKDDNH